MLARTRAVPADEAQLGSTTSHLGRPARWEGRAGGGQDDVAPG